MDEQKKLKIETEEYLELEKYLIEPPTVDFSRHDPRISAEEYQKKVDRYILAGWTHSGGEPEEN